MDLETGVSITQADDVVVRDRAGFLNDVNQEQSSATVSGNKHNRGPRPSKSIHSFASWKSENVLDHLMKDVDVVRELAKTSLPANVEIEKSKLAPPPANLTFSDLGFSIPLPKDSEDVNGTGLKTILEPCSGHLEAGQLVAIMGPSGCGKTTLLDMLAQKKSPSPHQTGTVLMNGHETDDLYTRVAAYVGQEDIMPKHWTVREAVEFNLSLKQRKPHNVPKEFRDLQVDIALETFGLSSVANTYIGGEGVRGISGGQRRRVTLARGVVSQASMFFLDEPTSGLSATDAETCIRALRIMAKRFGCLVLVVIHQPRIEVVELFDRLLLLTSNPGRMVYQGPMKDAKHHWASLGYPVPNHYNPVDHYMDLVTPDISPEAVKAFVAGYQSKLKPAVDEEVALHMLESKKGASAAEMIQAQGNRQEKAHMAPHDARMRARAVPFGGQLRTLLKRDAALLLRDPAGMQLPILVPIIQAILIGLMFQGIGNEGFADQLPFIFMITTLLCLSGLQQMPSLIEKRTIMKYDTSESLYSEQSWLISLFITSVPINYFGSFLNVIISFAFSGLSWSLFGTVFAWCSLLFFFYDSLYSFLAAVAGDAEQSNVMAVPFQLLFIMFSGFMVRQSSAPSFLRWLFPLSPNMYAMQSIVEAMAEDDPAAKVVAEAYGFKSGQAMQGLLVTLGMCLVLRILQVVALRFANRLSK